MEIAVATLATDRALLLLGVPGTAKTWVSEHLAAAISGDSTLLVQGTAGTTEETLRYGWNYARLLAEGPSEAALVPSPVYRAMRAGSIARVEELTRMPSDVQDALVMILSEKSLPVPELDTEVGRGPGLQPDRHRQRSRPGHQRAVERAAAALQHGRAPAPRDRRRGDGDRQPARRRARRGAGAAAGPRRRRRDPPRRHDLPRAARRRHRRRPRPASRCRAARCRRPRRSRWSPTGWRWPPTSATARSAPTTSRPASSARSCAIRCTTPSPGASTSRRSCATATAGTTSTTPAATLD